MKEEAYTYRDWRNFLKYTSKNSIDNEFVIIDNPKLEEVPKTPFKFNVTSVILCDKGILEGSLNLEPFIARSPCMVVILADRILELKMVSEDFKGQMLMMSKQFTDNLLMDADERLPLTISIENRPCVSLENEAFDSLKNYFDMMNKAVSITENPYRVKVARHLMLAYMYGMRLYFHPQVNEAKTHREILVERFLSQVKKDYKKERTLKYYAEKLCMTSKHLSKIISETTKMSANDWIGEYVMLEAKALLKSTDMTIQQICYELNFDNPSFFIKYFKRHLGKTPKEYRMERVV